MRWQWMALLAAVGAHMNWAGGGATADAPKPDPKAGWLGVFPELTGYQRTFTAPVVMTDKDKKPIAYRQTAKYEWTGGDIRLFEVTLARDPAFKQKYAAENLRKEAKAPKEVRVGKLTGWLWQFEPDKTKPDAIANRLVVPLAEDKVLIVEDKFGKQEIMLGLLEQFDLAGITKALEAPPKTE